MVQLRMKNSSPAERRRAAAETAQLKQDYDFCLIINDDPELAVGVGADGVHVGKGDQSIEAVRGAYGADLLIGYSSHALAEARDAEACGADYVAFGAIFPTSTKGPGHPVQGLERLREVRQVLRLPLVAIGGINAANARSVLETGVDAVAMISGLVHDSDAIAAETEKMIARISRHPSPSPSPLEGRGIKGEGRQ